MSSRRWLRSAIGLGLPGGLLATSCYFSPLPLPADPSPERPNLNLAGAVPPVFQVLQITRGVPINFTIPFTSVDAGQGIVWWLWVNWNLSGFSGIVNKGELPAGPVVVDGGLGGAAATQRELLVAWTPSNGVPPGCNQLTILVTHEENVEFTTDRPRDLSQAAIVTYWANVDAPIGQPQDLVDCPPPAIGP